MEQIAIRPEVLKAYGFKPFLSIRPLTGGHINNTLLVETIRGKFVLQQMNHFVFPSPADIMENMVGVTDFLQKKVLEQGGDPKREIITIRRTLSGDPYIIDETGEYWRCLCYIDHAKSYESTERLDTIFEAGRAFGNFQRMLEDYPAGTLHEIIENFHNTPERFRQLEQAIASNKASRKAQVEKEILFAQKRKESCRFLMDLLQKGELPLRVTHNDTKLSNILIDEETGKAICIIDLDTVMPGLAAFDFGDSIRACASTAAEDEADLTKVHFDLSRFEAYTKGFLSSVGNALTALELDTLPDGARLMTFEVGIRFLADYLNGDVYFKTGYPEHNLVRARNQFKLVEEMEAAEPQMKRIVQNLKIS